MKSAIRILSALLLTLMVFATLAPCISAEVQTTSAETTLNKSTVTKTTRVWSSDDTEEGRAKKAQNDSLLNDKRLYNNASSFADIYSIFTTECKDNNTFGSASSSIGNVSNASWHTSSVTLPTLSTQHPRLLVTSASIPNIKKALEEVTPTNERFFALLDMDVTLAKVLNDPNKDTSDFKIVDGKAVGGINNGKLPDAKTGKIFGRNGTHNYDGDYLEVIQIKALGYLIDGHELYGKQAIHCMKQFLKTLDIQKISGNQEREFGNVMFTAALVYDWCYDILENDEESRKQILAGVENKVARKTTKTGSDAAGWTTVDSFHIGFPPTKLGAVSGHGSERQLLRDMLSAAVAFYGDNNSWWNYIGTLFYEHYVPVRNYYFRSGISQQGVGVYASGRHISDLYSAWIMKTAAATEEGKYPYKDSNGVNLIANTIRNFLGYETTPGMLYTDGDGAGFGLFQQYNYEFHAHAHITAYLFEDEAMLAQAKDMRPDYAFGTDKTIDQTIEINSALYVAVTGMSDIEPAEDKYEGMPLIQYNGAPVGQYVTHEEYGVDDSASVFMKVKIRSTANHEHADAGNFMIYYKGMLTADTGCYDGYSKPHTRYYHQATISHNSLLVYNSNKPGIDNTDYYTGGQLWPDETTSLSGLKSETYHTGNIIGQRDAYYDSAQTRPKYAYLGGDITGAYHADTVNYVGRRMLVVYTEDENVPMLFFTYDRITADSQSYKKTYLFHITSDEAPTVNTTNRTIVTENGGGQLVLTCISDDVTISSIGGKTLDSDGNVVASSSKNYYINDTVKQVNPPSNYDDGSWGRVEIKNKNNESTSSFLNAMYVTDAGTTTRYQMKSITNVSTGSFADGVADLEGAVYNGKVAAVFVAKTIKMDDGNSINGNSYLSSKTVSFTTEGEDNMQYYVDGMATGNWLVSVNGEVVTSATAYNGLLTFDAPAGNVVLTKEDETTAAKRAELIETLGEKITNDDGAYSEESYSAYSKAYDEALNQIYSAIDVTALNAINVASLKSAAEAKLVDAVVALKAELIATLGEKKAYDATLYTYDSYQAYSTAYDNALAQINNAATLDALEEINVVSVKSAAESLLVAPPLDYDKDTIVQIDGSASKELIFNYSGTTSTEPVYSVDVVWTDLSFAYTEGSDLKWNPLEHDYSSQDSGPKWSDSSGSVNVKNHSNAAVKVEITFEKASTPNGTAELTVSGGMFNLKTAENTTYANAPSGTATIGATGKPTKTGAIGKIKVKISAS